MKKFLFLLFLWPLTLLAQENNKYMAGAVPEEDGMVVFRKTLKAPGVTKDQLYLQLLTWAQKQFIPQEDFQSRVLYSNQEKGEIVCQGEEYLVFTNKAFSLDRAAINYRLFLECRDGVCKVKIANIKYAYFVSSQDVPERYTAEEMITDENTLNKTKNKLIRKTGKFRIHTIDLVDKLFAEITSEVQKLLPRQAVDTSVNTPSSSSNPAQTVQNIPAAIAANPSSVATLQGYKQISPDKIPGNIYKMLSEDWMLITAGNDSRFNMMTASWGGLGHLYGKPVAFCFINPARHTYQLMEKNDTYTLSFYTETYRDALQYCGTHSGRNEDKVIGSGLTPITTPSGSKAFSEAWMIIECKKLIAQPFTPEALSTAKLQEEWKGKPLHKMYIGEILNVWVK